jgi:hypothetical protein
MRLGIEAAGAIVIVALAAVAWAPPAPAQDKLQDKLQDKPATPTFGSRNQLPDGSANLTVGRRLETEWDAKVGFDAKLAPELASPSLSDSLLQPTVPGRSTGVVWGTVTGPSVAPMLFDKTAVDARLEPGEDKGQVSATLSRTLPLGDASITVQDKYSVTQTLQGGGATILESDRSLRFKWSPTSTTLSAGVVTSTVDGQWYNRLSAEQKVVGPLSVTTTVTDPGGTAASKSIAAGFKHTW